MIRSTELTKKNSNQIQSANLNAFVWGSFSKLAVFHKHHRNGRLLPFWRRTLPKLQTTLLFCSPKPNFFRSHTLRHAELHPAGRLTVIEPENNVAWFRCFSFSKGGPVYSQVPAVKLPRLHNIPEFSDMHSLENQLEVLQKHLFETPSGHGDVNGPFGFFLFRMGGNLLHYKQTLHKTITS